MQLTTHVSDNDKVEYKTDKKTLGGADIVIITTPTGMYRIETRGMGQPPTVVDELFTDLNAARAGVQRYLSSIKIQATKKEIQQQAIDRRILLAAEKEARLVKG